MSSPTMLTSEDADRLSETHYLVEAISILTERPLLEASDALTLRINDVVNCLAGVAFRNLNAFHGIPQSAAKGGIHG